MHARPPGVPIFLVLGSILWIAVTIAVLAVIAADPARHSDLAIGLGLIWLALIAFAAVERWTGGRTPEGR